MLRPLRITLTRQLRNSHLKLPSQNHAYKFIFVRHPKAASSALLHHFTLCSETRATGACGGQGGCQSRSVCCRPCGRTRAGLLAGCPLLAACALSSPPAAACLEPWNGNRNSSVALYSPEELRELWKDYFVFTVVSGVHGLSGKAWRGRSLQGRGWGRC